MLTFNAGPVQQSLFALARQVFALLQTSTNNIVVLHNGELNAAVRLSFRGVSQVADKLHAHVVDDDMHLSECDKLVHNGADVVLWYVLSQHVDDVNEAWLKPVADVPFWTPKNVTHVLLLSCSLQHDVWLRTVFEQMSYIAAELDVDHVTTVEHPTVAQLLAGQVLPEFKYTNAELAAQIEQCK